MRVRGRRGAIIALIALASLAVAVPTHADVDKTVDQLEKTREELERVESELGAVEQRIGEEQSELARVDGQLADTGRELAALEQHEADARAAHRAAVAETLQIQRRLEAVTAELRAARSRLSHRKGAFENRVAAAYKYGTPTYADALVDSADFSDFVNSVMYVRSALDNDEHLVNEMSGLVRDVTRRRAEVDALHTDIAAKEESAEQVHARLVELTTKKRQVAEDLDTQRRRHAEIVEDLESDREQYVAHVAALEEESDRLAEELRKSRWEAGVALGELAWPTNGQPGSPFGYRTHPILRTKRLHAGMDIAAPTGQQIVAAAEGLVVHAGMRGGYGLAVVIDHGGGTATLYAHQSRIAVNVGEVVQQGDVIGYIGSTGFSTGPHLHFEVRVDGVPKDPMAWY